MFGILVATLAGCGARTGLEDHRLGGGPDGGASETPPVCVEAPRGGPPVDVELPAEVRLGAADVLMLLDLTESMGPELEAVQLSLRDVIVPGLAQAIPDVSVGVAGFADFPVDPFGARTDSPFQRIVDVTTDVDAVLDALSEVVLTNGGDLPESQVEALYQVATGAGLDPWIDPAPHAGPSGGVGFRAEALPVVVLVTDAAFHDGPSGLYPYEGLAPPSHSWPEAITALAAIGAEVVGLDSSSPDGPPATPDLEATASALGTLDREGAPVVVGLGGGHELPAAVVDMVTTLADDVRLDVDAVVEDVPGDAFDARELVASIRPLSAVPADGVVSIDEAAFRGAAPGTRLTFALTISNDGLEAGASTLVVPIEIIVRGNLRTTLRVLRVDVLVPSDDGAGCDET